MGKPDHYFSMAQVFLSGPSPSRLLRWRRLHRTCEAARPRRQRGRDHATRELQTHDTRASERSDRIGRFGRNGFLGHPLCHYAGFREKTHQTFRAPVLEALCKARRARQTWASHFPAKSTERPKRTPHRLHPINQKAALPPTRELRPSFSSRSPSVDPFFTASRARPARRAGGAASTPLGVPGPVQDPLPRDAAQPRGGCRHGRAKPFLRRWTMSRSHMLFILGGKKECRCPGFGYLDHLQKPV